MPYRFAIIGCGRIAPRHAEQIRKHGILAAVCDKEVVAAERAGAAWSVPFYSDPDSMIAAARPDVVVICSPNGLHTNHALLALNNGCHVLCEKPMTLSEDDAQVMISAARAACRKLFVVKQNRFNPAVLAVKTLLDRQELGKIHSFQLNCFWNRPRSYYDSDWRGTLALDGGTLFTQFSHFIDLLQWFAGDIATVHGQRYNYQHEGVIEFEDTGIACLRMESGAIGTLHYTINATGKNMEGSFTLFCERGTVKIGGEYLNTIPYFNVEGHTMPVLAEGAPANHYGVYEGSMSNHGAVYQQVIAELDRHGSATVEGPAPGSAVEAAEALKSVRMIRQIYAASPLISGFKPS